MNTLKYVSDGRAEKAHVSDNDAVNFDHMTGFGSHQLEADNNTLSEGLLAVNTTAQPTGPTCLHE